MNMDKDNVNHTHNSYSSVLKSYMHIILKHSTKNKLICYNLQNNQIQNSSYIITVICSTFTQSPLIAGYSKKHVI